MPAKGKGKSWKLSRKDTKRLAGLKVASRTIGDTAADRLAWIVGFAAEDSGTWDSKARAACEECLSAFASGGFPDRLVGGVELPSPLPRRDVETIHGELQRVLRALVNNAPGHSVALPVRSLGQPFVVRATGIGEQPAVFGVTYAHTSARSAVYKRLLDLVLTVGDRLVACRTCGAPFVRVRRQRYCSPACSQRARSATWYANHGEKARQARRAGYAKKKKPAIVTPRKRQPRRKKRRS